jgi:AraC family transcriptional regulator, arabinose operon regulatory protein
MRTSRKPRAVILRANPQLSILKQNCSDPRVHLALDLLAGDIKHKLRIEPLSQALNLSTSRLRHLFHDQLAMSPAQVLKVLRLQAANELLTSTLMRSKEVMAAVGLNDPSHFARDFKQAYGITPSQLRRQSDITRKRVGKHGTSRVEGASA